MGLVIMMKIIIIFIVIVIIMKPVGLSEAVKPARSERVGKIGKPAKHDDDDEEIDGEQDEGAGVDDAGGDNVR